MTEPRPLDPAARARIVRRAVTWLTPPVALAVAVAAGLLAGGLRAPAVGVAIGAATGLILAASWVAGAVWGFDRPGNVLLLATIGLWPLRVALLFVAAAAGAMASAEPLSLILTLIALHLWGHVVEAQTLSALVDATRPPR